MVTLQTFYPTTADLLAAPPEELAPILLNFAKQMLQNGIFLPDAVNDVATGASNIVSPQAGYPFHQRQQIASLLAETWGWIERNGLTARAPSTNGRNGWMMLTRQGEDVSSAEDFQRLRAAVDFPKSLLHPVIAEKAWRALMRNDLDGAVFASFKAVEEAVRAAGGFSAVDVGTALMRKAFDKSTGPLTDTSHPEAEREALAHLFAGAIGSYKNPHSHRTVNLTDPREAQEQIMLASHLLRIVEVRQK